MHDGYKVLRFKNNYKSKDLYLIGNEMNSRIGTSNYDKERTKFNIKYKELEKDNLYQDAKYKLESRNIEYLHKTKTNLLNGVTISSGPEFFMILGLPFKETDRKYKTGKKEGQNIWTPDIKSKNDIPKEVIKYFDESYNFLKELVSEENIVIAQVHFDEDTPHLQAYFLPVVNEVKRKCYQRDKDGNLIKEIKKDRNGKDKEVPILLRDKKGEMVYETVKGNFLNNDQFWKDLGGRNSFSKLQDRFNKYITSKGFNLDRGEIGANKYHQTKAEKYLKELQAENKLMELELNKNKVLNEVEISYKEKISNVDTKPLLNPEKDKIIGYKEKDINNLSKYSEEITKDNLNKSKMIEQNEIKLESKQKQIDKLNTEIKNLKSGKTLIEKDKIIENQNLIIKEKDETINYQNNIIESLKEELTNIKEMASSLIQNVKGIATDLYKALKRTLGLNVDKNQEYDSYEFKNLSKKINKKYELDKSDDFEL